MTVENESNDSSLAFPPTVIAHATLAKSGQRLPVIRGPRALTLSNVALASGIALAIEGVRFAARVHRERMARKATKPEAANIAVRYEWTQITYERFERS